MGPLHVPWLWSCLTLAFSVATASAEITANGPPYLLNPGTWVCSTPEAYDQAVAEQAKTNGREELLALKEHLLSAKSCMYVDDDDIEDMMATFVQVVERQCEKIKVVFTIEFYKKYDEIHAAFNRVRFSGWTAENRLADYHPLEG
jgi:hypothetical protein